MKKQLHIKNSIVCTFVFCFCLLQGVLVSKAQVGNYTALVSTGVAPEDMNGFSPLFFSGQDNTSSTVQNIGFTFTFNNIAYTQFSTNSNGLLRLGSTVVSTNAINQLTVNSDFPKITAYWDDLNTSASGYCGYKLIGTAPNRKLSVEWILAIPKNSPSNSGRFQVWLYESTNVIQFVYSTGMIVNPGGYSVGLASSATDFLSAVPNVSSATFSKITESNANTALISSGVSYTFTPPVVAPGCVSSSTPLAGSTGLAKSTSLSWTAGTGNPTSYDVYFGTASNPPLVAPNQVANTFNPGVLNSNTTYFYKIVPRNSTGPATGCAINSFTTAPNINFNVNRFTGVTYTSVLASGTSFGTWRNGSNTDDNLSASQPIGFNFPYLGSTFSNFSVSTNGFITFNTGTSLTGNGNGAYSYTNSLGLTDGTLIIAPFYEDMVCQGNPGSQSSLDASIRYLTSGPVGSRILTVEWAEMEIYNNPGPNLNFQLKLYEATGEVEFVYGTMEAFNGTFNSVYSYSIGLNSAFISPAPLEGEYFNQVNPNTRNFGPPSTTQLNEVPFCNTSLKLTPGAYIPYILSTTIPTNDFKTSAQHLDVASSPCTSLCGIYYSSLNATSTAGLNACSGGNADDDVWFEFTATNPNTTVKVMGSGNYNAAVELYNSSNTLLVCSDFTLEGLSETINTSSLTIGAQYFIRVYHSQVGSGGASGQFGICVSATPVPPTNDNCAAAISLPVTVSSNFTTGSQTIAATASAGIPLCSVAGTFPDDDVWYSFVATNTTEVVTVAGGSGFNAVIQLFSGNCGALTSIQCVNNLGNGQTEVLTANNLITGLTYLVRVYHAGVGGGSGLFSINISTNLPTCAATMIPANATSFVPSAGSILKWSSIPNVNSYKVYLDVVNPPSQVLINTTDTFALTGLMQQGLTYYWKVNGVNTSGESNGCNINAFATEPLDYALRVKVFIEGMYSASTHSMAPLLNPNDTLSDTITVELTSPVTKLAMYTSKGVLSTTGTANILFPQPALGQSYYIVVKHRNSLQTWSAGTFAFNSPDTIYDFTTAASMAFGNRQIQLEPGVFGIHTGDLNQDGVINFTDIIVQDNSVAAGIQVGYQTGDINGDGIVESADYSWIENKVQVTVTSSHP